MKLIETLRRAANRAGALPVKRVRQVVIIQDRPTQFDVPLYAKIDAGGLYDLTVFYTVVDAANAGCIDAEIALSPQWDHLKGLKYKAQYVHSLIITWRELVGRRPDHVIISGWYPRSHAVLALLLRISGIRIGVRCDNTLEHTRLSGLRGRFKRLAMSVWLGLYHTWHPVGTLACDYIERLSLAKRPVYYFPYAIDVSWFKAQAAQHKQNLASLRHQMGWTIDDYVVLGVMKWSDREDPLTLVDAVLKAKEKDPRIKLILVGDGSLHDAVMSRISVAPDCIVTPGYAKYSALPMYYAMADVFVHPAQSEPYGVSVQEAMACGLAVITSDGVGAAVDFIELGVNGDIFPVGDVARLAELLVEFACRLDKTEMSIVSARKAEEWSYQRSLCELQACLSQAYA